MEKSKSEKLFVQLCSNLEGIIKKYRVLLDLLRKEKDFIITSNIEKLSRSNIFKDTLLLEIKELEEKRGGICAQFAEIVGIKNDNIKLKDFNFYLQSDQSERLRDYHSVLDLLLKRIKEINKVNEKLIRSALNTLNGAISSIKKEFQTRPIYKKEGNLKDPSTQTGSFVSKEI